MHAQSILEPVLAMAVLTVVMTIWMTVTRIREMARRELDAQQAQNTAKLDDLLPERVQRIAHNYNNLFEQPTLFYAVALTIALLDHVDALHVQCAWVYVALRVAHSGVQATVDIVRIRVSIWLLSWLVLGVMTLRESFALLAG